MKIIVVSGSYSKIGKSTLAANIENQLKHFNVKTIKIGHNKPKEHKNVILFQNIPEGLKYIKVLQQQNPLDFLIIESNSILDYIDADLVIFLRNYDKPEKQSSKIAIEKADIIIDKNLDFTTIDSIISQKLKTTIIKDTILNQYNFMFN
ncbi:MAG: hypothetical protein AB1782_11985 [Cyanobacteriota bacterium]